MNISPQDIDAIAEATSNKLKESHTCQFSEHEAEVVRGFGRAVKAHNAGEKELFIVIQVGKNLTEFMDRAGKTILWTLIIGAAVFLLSGVIPVQWKFWK